MARETSRFGLSDINYITTDPQSILTSIVSAYESAAERTLAEGDPVYIFLETIASVIVSLRNQVNQAARETTLSYATGGFLDAIGVMVDTPRREASGAQTTLQFTLAAAKEAPYQIPQGTRATDTTYVFATDETLIIPAGETVATVGATSTTAGAASNGVAIGSLDSLVDPLPGVTVTNTTVSIGGADVEDDDTYAARIALAPESFASAGPVGAYRYHTLAAHPDIAEVAVTTPVPGTVDVRPVLSGGELPNAEILQTVRDALNAENVRPLTDTVIVAAPALHEYTIDVSWSLAKADEPLLETVTAQVAAAVEKYRLWQRTMPGRDINPTKLISLMEQAGARRVVVTSPTFLELDPTSIARETSVSITYLGAEDE